MIQSDAHYGMVAIFSICLSVICVRLSLFSHVHATLQPTLSVRRVGWLIDYRSERILTRGPHSQEKLL